MQQDYWEFLSNWNLKQNIDNILSVNEEDFEDFISQDGSLAESRLEFVLPTKKTKRIRKKNINKSRKFIKKQFSNGICDIISKTSQLLDKIKSCLESTNSLDSIFKIK